MKILIIGYGRHGKDTLADILTEKYNGSFESSSKFALDTFLYDELKNEYKSKEDCYADRHNRRKYWYERICCYNKDDKGRLCKELLRKHDGYVGMRDLDEYLATKNEFDLKIWVDASKRIPTIESSESMKLNPSHADIIIDNNGTLEEFKEKVYNLFNCIIKKY